MKIKKQEIYNFESETKEILQLMIHSLYSKKEIFLRELLSNASDAAEKLRFLCLSNNNLYENNNELKVQISFDKKKKTIIIEDNCIGMNRNEVIKNIGTIAKSGTKNFLKKIKNIKLNSSKLIGKFGIGFYSAFIVSKKVIIETRMAGDKIENGVMWESSGEGQYYISKINKINKGTKITLYLKKENYHLLDYNILKNIIIKYSEYIKINIEIQKNNYIENNNKLNKNIEWEKIKKPITLWIKDKKYITDKEYIDFYKFLTNDTKDPLLWIHNKVEGKYDYINLIYIPSVSTLDIWNRDNKSGLKLYIKNIFIMDDTIQFIPNYLRFVKGIIDSKDLPLNVSREVLQDNNITVNIKKVLINRILSSLEKLFKQNITKYYIFWKQFGNILKEGFGEDLNNINKLSNLLLFSSTYNDTQEQNISLEDYFKRIKKEQKKIYFLTSDNYITAKNSPHLEFFNKNNIEVILFYDKIDEWVMNYLTEYKGLKFHSINKTDNDLNLLNKKKDIINKNEKLILFNDLIKKIKNYLGNRVQDVKLTYKLTNTPSIVTISDNSMTTQMAKLFIAANQSVPEIKYIFEINPNHKLINYILNITDTKQLFEWIELLLEQALLIEKGNLENPNKFIKRINKLLLSK